MKIASLVLIFGSFIPVLTENASAAPIQAYSKPAALSGAQQTGEISRPRSMRLFVPQTMVPQTVEGRRSTRSYSYIPGSAPTMRRYMPARVPSYLLPKSDPRKYNGF